MIRDFCTSSSAIAARVSWVICVEDRLGRPGPREQPVEVGSHHARQTGLDRGRNIGRGLHPLLRGDRQDADIAGAVELQQRPADIGRHHRDMSGGEIGHAGRGALVGDVRDLRCADQMLEQLAGQIGHGAGAGRAIGQLGGIGLGVGDELRERTRRHQLVHHDAGRARGT